MCSSQHRVGCIHCIWTFRASISTWWVSVLFQRMMKRKMRMSTTRPEWYDCSGVWKDMKRVKCLYSDVFVQLRGIQYYSSSTSPGLHSLTAVCYVLHCRSVFQSRSVNNTKIRKHFAGGTCISQTCQIVCLAGSAIHPSFQILWLIWSHASLPKIGKCMRTRVLIKSRQKRQFDWRAENLSLTMTCTTFWLPSMHHSASSQTVRSFARFVAGIEHGHDEMAM